MDKKKILEKPDIVEIIENGGIKLKRKGKYLWALCPLHTERRPSFKVDPKGQSFYCFGCHEHGDVIVFVRRFKNLNFKEALAYLGIDGRPQTDPQERRKRQLVKAFREWCDNYYSDLCLLLRTLWKAKQQVKDEADLEKLAEFYHKESLWLYQIEILQGNDDESKFELYREVELGEI